MVLDADRLALNLLHSRLDALIETPESGAQYPVTYPNRNEDRPAYPYFETQHFDVDRDDPTFGALRTIQGIFQITVVAKKGDGETQGQIIAGIVRDHFGAVTHIQSDALTVTLHKQPRVRAPVPDTDAHRIPVSVFYKTHA